MPSLKLTALALALSLSAHEGVEGRMTRTKHEFIRKMKESELKNGPIRMSRPSLARFLQKSEMMSNLKSPKVDKDELERRLNYYDNYQKFANSGDRKLADNNDGGNPSYNSNYNGYNANNADVNNNNVQNNANHWWNWWSGSGNNVANNFTEGMYDDDGDNTTYVMAGLGDLSVKYAGCSSTTSFIATDDEDTSNFQANALVQYRLCPTESCDDDGWDGCKSEYGEYMMTLRDFLDTQTDLREEEFKNLCQYCEKCYEFNDSAYCDNGNCCSHGNDCKDYDEACFGDEDDDEIPDYEDLFECMEVDLSSGRRQLAGQDNGDDVSSSVGYVGVHCNGMNIEVGLFSDNTCSSLIATEEQVDIYDLTGYDFNTQDIEEYFLPQGCLQCGGEEYNWKQQWWYFKEDKDDVDDDDYVNKVCYEMYESSAKCNQKLAEDIQEKLEESDDEYANEQIACDFIKDAVLGHIDEYGFVSTHEGTGTGNPNQSMWGWMTGQQDQTPVYTGNAASAVTSGQAAALSMGVIGTVAMAGAALFLQQKINKQSPHGLVAKPDKIID